MPMRSPCPWVAPPSGAPIAALHCKRYPVAPAIPHWWPTKACWASVSFGNGPKVPAVLWSASWRPAAGVAAFRKPRQRTRTARSGDRSTPLHGSPHAWSGTVGNNRPPDGWSSKCREREWTVWSRSSHTLGNCRSAPWPPLPIRRWARSWPPPWLCAATRSCPTRLYKTYTTY